MSQVYLYIIIFLKKKNINKIFIEKLKKLFFFKKEKLK